MIKILSLIYVLLGSTTAISAHQSTKSITHINYSTDSLTQLSKSSVTLKKNKKKLYVVGHIPKPIKSVEIRIESDRNKQVTRMTDVSENDPKPKKRLEMNLSAGTDTFYPVVDVALEPGMDGVAEFRGNLDGKVIVGGPFFNEGEPLKKRMIISGNKLEYWENSIYLDKAREVNLNKFYLIKRLPVIAGKIEHTFDLLSEDWSGNIAIFIQQAHGAKEIAKAIIPFKKPKLLTNNLDQHKGKGISRNRLIESLKATVGFTLRSQNVNSNSPTSGGPFLFYDLNARMYRTSYWMWGWGPSVKLLIDAAKISDVAEEFGSNDMLSAANDIGIASLKMQVNQEHSPADGLSIASWTRNFGTGDEYENGYRICVTATDALFLAGWAWMPLYEETGDQQYLKAFKRLSEATQKLMDDNELLPWIYYYNLGTWSNYVLNESGYGVKGLSEAYRLTADENFQNTGIQLMEQHRVKFQRDDGLWERLWLYGEQKARPSIFHTRAQGWAMEGLLSAAELKPESFYLDQAEKMADVLIKWQHSSGYWTHDFKSPVEEAGISEKGTALWSHLLYRLYKMTDNEKYLEHARLALIWCLDNQYTGLDQEAFGSIVGRTRSSAVGYRWWFDVSCVYTSGFFGLAVMDELDIQENNK